MGALAGISPLLTVAGIGLSVAGEIQAGRVATAEAKSAQAMANYNAAIQEQEAKAIEQRTSLEQRRQAEEAARVMSTLQARIGVAGAVPTVGAPLQIQAKQASEFELENLMIGYRGRTEAGRARSAAELERMQAGIYGERAKTARRAGYIGAGATLLTGFGGMDWAKKPKTTKLVSPFQTSQGVWIGAPSFESLTRGY